MKVPKKLTMARGLMMRYRAQHLSLRFSSTSMDNYWSFGHIHDRPCPSGSRSVNRSSRLCPTKGKPDSLCSSPKPATPGVRHLMHLTFMLPREALHRAARRCDDGRVLLSPRPGLECMRRNFCSGTQTVQQSCTLTLNAPSDQPSSTTQLPSGSSATCHSVAPNGPESPSSGASP